MQDRRIFDKRLINQKAVENPFAFYRINEEFLKNG
jgi:hypothetical protein